MLVRNLGAAYRPECGYIRTGCCLGGLSMWQALGRIAGALNESGVLWCIGASLLLHQYGLAEHPHDIDLLVALPDAERAAGILGAMGEAFPCGQSSTYSTEFFRRFRIDGCDVDLMAGFRVNHSSGCYEYAFDAASVASTRELSDLTIPFDAGSVAPTRVIGGTPIPFDAASVASTHDFRAVLIPFAALEDWYVVYQLIPGKEHKALRIEEYLLQQGIENPHLLARALEGSLPESIRQRIFDLFASVL